ncbi:MAG TPA: hypothetical protein VGS03_20960 [Candidatus Polarisedimenticolia bacterium]|jgi:hypothetical protein|nr:hypothetical protein [Candidatus Polarisedimenticolia bacterium]
MKTHALLVLLAVVFLMTSGGMTARGVAPVPAPSVESFTLASADFSPADVCSVASDMVPGEDHAERVPPGCCTTQCNVDRDCNKICGKGVCACIQETSCCRRCVY